MTIETDRAFPTGEVSLNDLTPPEQFLLWAMRMWVRIASNPAEARDFMKTVFARAGVCAGGVSFHRFMCAFTAGANRTVRIRCPRSVVILDDERNLLRGLSYAQQGHGEAARAVLEDFVDPGALEALYAHAHILMQTCRKHSLAIRAFANDPHPQTVRELAPGATAAQYVQGNATMH